MMYAHIYVRSVASASIHPPMFDHIPLLAVPVRRLRPQLAVLVEPTRTRGVLARKSGDSFAVFLCLSLEFCSPLSIAQLSHTPLLNLSRGTDCKIMYICQWLIA